MDSDINNQLTIIEICGIPYSRKTTTILKMAKHLRQNGIKFQVIDEFRGDGGFYDKAKYSPDLNLVRSLRCLGQIVAAKYSNYCEVILIDRGVFDSYCWFKWFESKNKASPEIIEFGEVMLKLIKGYSNKYHVAWLDIDPDVSISHHSHQGTIVNKVTLEELRHQYSSLAEDRIFDFVISRIESDNVTSNVIAERLVKKFKLEKHSNK